MEKLSVIKSFVVLFIATFVVPAVFAESCQKPKVEASAYVTEDATVLTKIAFTTQFTLQCSNGVKGISLYAEINGKALPAVKLSADNKYQVSTLHFIFLNCLFMENVSMNFYYIVF